MGASASALWITQTGVGNFKGGNQGDGRQEDGGIGQPTWILVERTGVLVRHLRLTVPPYENSVVIEVVSTFSSFQVS